MRPRRSSCIAQLFVRDWGYVDIDGGGVENQWGRRGEEVDESSSFKHELMP
jgi:hypothetical protein